MQNAQKALTISVWSAFPFGFQSYLLMYELWGIVFLIKILREIQENPLICRAIVK